MLKEVRNQCAHLELITRFRLKRTRKLKNYNDVTKYAGLSRTDLNYMDVVKIFKMFGGIQRPQMDSRYVLHENVY